MSNFIRYLKQYRDNPNIWSLYIYTSSTCINTIVELHIQQVCVCRGFKFRECWAHPPLVCLDFILLHLSNHLSRTIWQIVLTRIWTKSTYCVDVNFWQAPHLDKVNLTNMKHELGKIAKSWYNNPRNSIPQTLTL
jgi:hypothetical protein